MMEELPTAYKTFAKFVFYGLVMASENVHIAYMKVIPIVDVEPGDVIYYHDMSPHPDMKDTPRVHIEGTRNVVGVSDRHLTGGEIATIVVAGVTTVYCHEDAHFPNPGEYITTNRIRYRGSTTPVSISPIGTLVRFTEGKVVAGTYYRGVKIFLCPWLSAVTIPVTGTQLNLEHLFTPAAYAAFKNKLIAAWELDTGTADGQLQLERTIATIQEALHTGVAVGVKFLTVPAPVP